MDYAEKEIIMMEVCRKGDWEERKNMHTKMIAFYSRLYKNHKYY